MRLPVTVARSMQTLVGLIALSAVTTVLMVVLKDRLIVSWATSSPGRLDELRDGSIHPPAFVPVAIVLFVVVASLIGVLLVFFRNGEGWARLCLSALIAFTGVATVGALHTTPPTVFIVMAAASLVVELVALVFMWHPATSDYLAGRWVPPPAKKPPAAP